MRIILSPAKRLADQVEPIGLALTTPRFIDHAALVMNTLRKKSAAQLAKLQGISDDLAKLNFQRNQSWQGRNASEVYPAGLLFQGDVYLGLDAASFTRQDWEFAQQHVVILSGMYGALRPLDGIEPYRLEMGTSLPIARKKNLYAFWKEDMVHLAAEFQDDVVLNLASTEYAKVLVPHLSHSRIIDVQFLDWSNGKFKPVQFWVKKARGFMARYVVQNQITNPEDLKDFTAEGYAFQSSLSSEHQWVFTRGH